MPHPLDGAKLKVVRAKKHLHFLKCEISRYLDLKPYDVFPKTDVKIDSPITRTITVNIPPPDPWSTVVGDCVNNARAALDYIAWELGGLPFFTPARTIEDRQWLSFPISQYPYAVNPTPAAQWYADRINRLSNRGVPTRILDEIKAVQPHNTGYEPLWWLHELVNTDKHRSLLLTTAKLGDVSIIFKESTFVDCSFVSSPGLKNVSLSNTNTETITLRTDPVEMDVQASVHVTLKDVLMPQEPIELALEQIVVTVAEVISRFEAFF